MDESPSIQHLADRQLAERCCQGDAVAQRDVYDRTSERIYRLLLKMTGNPDHAFDLAQETYVRAFTRMNQFDGRASLATWLYRIAVNEALQFTRRQTIADAKLACLSEPPEPESGNGKVEVRIDVTEALTTLSAADRVILLLRYQDGLDYAAIAEITGSPQGTVGSRLNRARQKLRELLQNGYDLREESDPTEHPIDDGLIRAAKRIQAARPSTGESGLVSP